MFSNDHEFLRGLSDRVLELTESSTDTHAPRLFSVVRRICRCRADGSRSSRRSLLIKAPVLSPESVSDLWSSKQEPTRT
jgi:hypothetical protein